MGAFFAETRGEASMDDIEIAKTLKQRTNVVLDGLIAGTFKREDVKQFDEDLLLFHDPRAYIGQGSEEIKYVRTYENLIASTGRWLGYNPAGFSTLRFFQTLELIKSSQPKK